MISTLQKPDETKAARTGITDASFGTKPHAQELQHITELIDQQRVKVFVSNLFPVERFQDAFRTGQSGHVQGKIVLTM